MIGGDTAQIKKINTNLIRQVMLTDEAWTKDSLALKTGLSTATCRKILMEMLVRGEVAELSLADPNGGRPARRFGYNRKFILFLLVRLDNSEVSQGISVSLADSGGEVIQSEEFVAKQISVPFLLDSLKGMVKQYPNIESIAVSYPGIIFNGKTICWMTESILDNVELASVLEKEFGIPTVVENDINLAAWGYASQLPGRKANIAYIGIPERSLPGCGLVIDGKLLKGSRGFAGEVMYIENLTWEEQKQRLKRTPHGLAEMLWVMLRPITALLDPRQVIIAGKAIPPGEQRYILEKCEKMFSHEFLPELVFLNDHLADNFRGLLDFARRQFYRVGGEELE